MVGRLRLQRARDAAQLAQMLTFVREQTAYFILQDVQTRFQRQAIDAVIHLAREKVLEPVQKPFRFLLEVVEL